MWAFAIWDEARQALFCSRDRMGIKPFYYHLDGSSFIFASEIKALLATGKVTAYADEAAVYDYLNFGRKDHTSGTFIDGVNNLPAAHNLLVTRDGRISFRRYWSLAVNRSPRTASPQASSDSAAHLLELIRDAVRIHLRSDVPTGICLSGGLDSSTIVVVASELLGQGRLDPSAIPSGLRCYTSHFPGEAIDETRHATTIVDAVHAQSIWVEPDGEKLFERMDELVYHLDEPFVSTSMFAQWMVIERAAQDGVKVLLDGQGGDEVFGGYPKYAGVYLNDLVSHGRFMTAWDEGRLLRAGPEPRPWATAGAELSRHLYAVLPSTFRTMARGRMRAVGQVLQPAFAATQSGRDLSIAAFPNRMNLQDRLYDDVTQSNLPALLRYEDRISMAFGVEARVPLLDYRIVEYAFSLPASAKIHDGWTKFILREAMRGLLPETIRLRRDKLGFPTPQGRWLGARLDWLRSLFSQSHLRSAAYLQGATIARRLPELLSSEAGAREVWRWLCLELWMRRFSVSALETGR